MTRIAVITPTRDRPRAVALALQLCSRSNYEGLEVTRVWVGSPVDVASGPGLLQFSIETPAQRPDLDLLQNVRRGIQFLEASGAEFDRVVIMEDDDWYHPDYLQWQAARDEYLTGIAASIYYNVRNRTWQDCGNQRHASLCMTSFSWSHRHYVKAAVNRCLEMGNPWLDIMLWGDEFRPEFSDLYANRLDDYSDDPLSVGIKGIPGSKNIGMGKGKMKQADPDGTRLRYLIGDEVGLYAKMYQP